MYLVACSVYIDECRKQGIAIPEQFMQSLLAIGSHVASMFLRANIVGMTNANVF